MVMAVGLAGCHARPLGDFDFGWPFAGPPPPGPLPAPAVAPDSQLPNPLSVPMMDHEFLWNQLVDTLDDYFLIESERRVQFVGGILTEGRIETEYLPGATALEPWRQDSASRFELAHATLQSIRRRGSVRVVPTETGFSIAVNVDKELEEVDRPSHYTPGSSTPRHDGSLFRDRPEGQSPRTISWIPQGRDLALEQEILYQLYGRLFEQRQQ